MMSDYVGLISLTWIIIRGNKEFTECQDHEALLEKGFWDRRYGT